MTVVVDSSVVVAGLASADATGEWAESVLAGEPLAAPHLMPVEAAGILHRAELAGEISADAASLAHADIGRLRVEYFPYDPFAARIWELRSPGLAEPPSERERARRLFQPGPSTSGSDDPAEMLADSYGQQVAMLQRIRRGLADLHTTRKQVELQMTALTEGVPAEEMLPTKLRQSAGERLEDLRSQYRSIRQQEDRLANAAERLQAKIDARRQQKEATGRSGRPELTCYEAWYVALAEFLEARLATLDTRLALVPGVRCGFCLPPPLSA